MVTKEMIKNSMEAKWRERFVVMFAILIAICVPFILVTVGNGESLTDMIKIVGVPMIPLLLILLYETVCYFMLFLHRRDYEIYEVLLDRPTTSFWYRGCVYFTVDIDTKSGMGIYRKTKPIWSDHPLSKFKAWEYMNSKIHIAYDEERDKMIILGSEGDYERNYPNK